MLATTAVLLPRRDRPRCLAFEWGNLATLGSLPEVQRPLNALFESVSFRTAGMSTVPIGPASPTPR